MEHLVERRPLLLGARRLGERGPQRAPSGAATAGSPGRGRGGRQWPWLADSTPPCGRRRVSGARNAPRTRRPGAASSESVSQRVAARSSSRQRGAVLTAVPRQESAVMALAEEPQVGDRRCVQAGRSASRRTSSRRCAARRRRASPTAEAGSTHRLVPHADGIERIRSRAGLSSTLCGLRAVDHQGRGEDDERRDLVGPGRLLAPLAEHERRVVGVTGEEAGEGQRRVVLGPGGRAAVLEAADAFARHLVRPRARLARGLVGPVEVDEQLLLGRVAAGWPGRGRSSPSPRGRGSRP